MKKISIIRSLVREFIADMRCAMKYGDRDFAQMCVSDIRNLYRNRHSTTINQFGWPNCLKQQ